MPADDMNLVGGDNIQIDLAEIDHKIMENIICPILGIFNCILNFM
jgi:hypothetical protein